MAKKGQVIAISSILAAMAIIGFGMKVLGDVWQQAEKHSTQAEQVKVVVEDVRVLKPAVIEHDKKIAVIEIQLDTIASGIEKIQRKLDID